MYYQPNEALPVHEPTAATRCVEPPCPAVGGMQNGRLTALPQIGESSVFFFVKISMELSKHEKAEARCACWWAT